ncbi:MAG: rhodanese-like domain-containing protein [Verrucomicrobiota bacterium]
MTNLLISKWSGLALAFGLAAGSHAFALTPAELKAKLAKGENVTIIDVRNNAEFAKGHIPGAMNIPQSLVPEKKLPALGATVVYDSGLGPNIAQTAADALNQKNGIRAEVLEGGYAAWENVKGDSTAAPGFKPEELPVITYDQLKKASIDEVVLVDLRKPAATPNAVKAAAAPPLTDLAKEFPGARVTKSAFSLPQARQSLSGSGAAPLLVLIDNGDGSAQETARKLRAGGQKRVVILAGGEEILARGGKAGLQRQGLGAAPSGFPVPTTEPKP